MYIHNEKLVKMLAVQMKIQTITEHRELHDTQVQKADNSRDLGMPAEIESAVQDFNDTLCGICIFSSLNNTTITDQLGCIASQNIWKTCTYNK